MTRLQWEPNGEPYVPGNLEVWKEILRQKSDSRIVRDWGKRAGHFEPSRTTRGSNVCSLPSGD